MTALVPKNQLVEQNMTTRVGQDFTDVAEALTRRLNEWIEQPLEVISLEPDPSAYFGCRARHKHTIDELSSLQWG
jgi:hypothetical protein